MEFFATNGKRPIRLSEATRRFAFESLNYKYGKETWEIQSVSVDDYEDFSNRTPLQKYDAMIERIVNQAPLRICADEKISGAATLGRAIREIVPVTYNGKGIFYAVSHLTIDFETVLKKGINEIYKQAQNAFTQFKGTEKEPFIRSCIHCIDCMRIWHKRYLDELHKKSNYQKNYENLKKVPFGPASNFYEAVQSIWFTFAFVRLCGNWPGIGRIDWLLGDYLKRDLEIGVLTLDEAREILAHFFIKGCEWVKGGDYGSGDAQHYQNILLAGRDENGNEITNEVTYLVLDILEELGISDFPTTVRVNQKTDNKLLNRISEVIRYGGGIIAVYNEDLIIESLINYGYDQAEAWKFANDGCWEVQIPGKTFFTYIPFDALQILQQKTLKHYDEQVSFENYKALYDTFVTDLKMHVENLAPWKEFNWSAERPCTVVSLFEQGCIERGCSYLEGGPIYNVLSPHIGGLPDVVNSLYAIKKLVFEEKKVSFGRLMQLLKNNWEDDEMLRQYALNRFSYFGNDNDEVDVIAKDIIDDFAQICDELQSVYKTPAGISTFGRQLEWAPKRFATPYGKKAHTVLSGNFSPTPGTNKEGATAIIKSYCKANLMRTVSGAALDIKLLPSVVNGEKGLEAIKALIRGFITLGGHFIQFDIADTEILKKAQERPEDYQNLSVRVSGWNARFVTLNKEWQDMIIAQTGSDF